MSKHSFRLKQKLLISRKLLFTNNKCVLVNAQIRIIFSIACTEIQSELHVACNDCFGVFHRRQPSLTGQDTIASSLPPTGASGGSGDLESLKQEILSEMRLEMNKMKSEIIAGKTAARCF